MTSIGLGEPYDPDELFTRARDGDPNAWEQLVAVCSPKLIRVVRRRLSPPMRSLYDSSDFVNDVFKSLVAKSDHFDFPNLAALKAYLVQAAEQKITDEYRRQHRQKRDRSRERPLFSGADDEGTIDEPAGSDPTPSQYAQARETEDQLLSESGEHEKLVISLKAQHYSNEEVAAQTGIHLRTIQRFLKKVFDTRFVRA